MNTCLHNPIDCYSRRQRRIVSTQPAVDLMHLRKSPGSGFMSQNPKTDDLACSWKLFALLTRPHRLEEAHVTDPIFVLYGLAMSGLFALVVFDLQFLLAIWILAVSAAFLIVAALCLLAEGGNYKLARWVVTVGRRILKPDELLEIMKWAPTPEMRQKVKEIVAANPVVRIRDLLPLHAVAAETAKRLEKARRDLEMDRARDLIMRSGEHPEGGEARNHESVCGYEAS